jgi:N-acetylglucosaminyldiphosphoundecaprenol N-acetyl-beta-D-mannosaminyltransferase
MPDETIVILGIPVDNLTMNDAVRRIFSMVADFKKDNRARLVATVNVDFMVNSHAWFRKHIRHPELLDILRRADMVTADGMPIVWASKFLGTPLKERVTGADLVPALAEEAGKRGKSIFFLGGRGDVGQKAADLLKERYPDFQVADVYSPFVHVEGEALYDTESEDQEIVDRINRSCADILLIAFGNPKQEIWFERNRLKLQVPVSIGIGGTYEFIVGSVSRAPEWMQKRGLEWIYRMTQDPKRLIKRYAIGFFKFGFMLWPALVFYRYQVLRLKAPILAPPRKSDVYKTHVMGEMNVIAFPDRVDAGFVKAEGENVQQKAAVGRYLVLDFGGTNFVDSSGLGFIVKLWKAVPEGNHEIYFIGIRATVIQFFKMTRLWDLFSKKAYGSLEELIAHLNKEGELPPFFMMSEEENDGFVVLRLSGRLDGAQMSRIQMDEVVQNVGERDCILNLFGLDFVDGSGLFFFLKIQKALARKGKQCFLCSASDNVLQIFRISKLIQHFSIEKNVEAVKKKLA